MTSAFLNIRAHSHTLFLSTIIIHIHSVFFLLSLIIHLSDEDLEIELVEEEPPFLRGHTKQSMDMSPVKIVKVIKDSNSY